MKKGWRYERIDQLARLVTKGTTPTTVGFRFEEDGVNFVKVESISTVGTLRVSQFAKISSDCHRALKRSRLEEGDLLFSIAGALGRSALVPASILPANTNQALAIIRLNDKAAIDRQFLLYALSPSLVEEQIAKFRGGVAQQNLSLAQIRELTVPIPPLEEQKRIVAVLDEAFEGLSRARANAEANLNGARELFDAYHRAALKRSDEQSILVRFDEVAEITSSLVDPRLDDYTSLPHLGAGNMLSGSDELIDVRTAQEEGLKSAKYLFDSRMVLYSKIRPYLRKAARPDFDGLCSADVYPLLPKVGVLDRDYLFHLLLGPDFTEYAISGSARAGMPKVNRDHLFDYQFSIPSVETQKEVAGRLDELKSGITSLSDQFHRKLTDLGSLRQSLLQKAFSGELT